MRNNNILIHKKIKEIIRRNEISQHRKGEFKDLFFSNKDAFVAQINDIHFANLELRKIGYNLKYIVDSEKKTPKGNANYMLVTYRI